MIGKTIKIFETFGEGSIGSFIKPENQVQQDIIVNWFLLYNTQYNLYLS
jgi:hypothetical protein